MFNGYRNQTRVAERYSITNGKDFTYMGLRDIAIAIRESKLPYSITSLGKGMCNVVVYGPNQIIEFQVSK